MKKEKTNQPFMELDSITSEFLVVASSCDRRGFDKFASGVNCFLFSTHPPLCDYLHPSFERLSFGQPTEIELQSEDLVEAFQDNGGFNMYLSEKPC
jgi:hypothetical protein